MEWPDLTICKNPRDKDQVKYAEFIKKGMSKSFANESEYQNLLESVFFTKPEETVFALSIGPDYLTALNRAYEIPVEPPYVEITIVDFYYFGLCATVHFEALRSYMIEKGEIGQEEIDSSFQILIWVKVSSIEDKVTDNIRIVLTNGSE